MMTAASEQAAMGGWARVATAAPTQVIGGATFSPRNPRTREVLIFIEATL
jgi:hypothetical protein